MTVSSASNRVSFSGNGSTTVFAYNFKIFSQSDLTVILRSSDGTETTQSITTHYTVSGVGSDSGGNVTFGTAPASGVTIVILREQPLTQGLDLVANDPFPSASIEESLDKLTFVLQQHDEELGRVIKASKTNVISGSEFTVSATDRANKVFAFDSSGNLSVTQELGTYKGNWAASTVYVERDLVKDTSNNNIYLVNSGHTSSGSQPLSSNANSAKYDLIVDAGAASTSATASATSATASASSATTSGSSATSAASSATTATTKASEAASSATAAASSATSAAASFDDFDDRYLGAKSTSGGNPTVDNDGDALVDGALFFDTTNNVMMVYNLGTTTWLRTTPTSSNQTKINTVEGSISNVNSVGNSITSVNTAASNLSGITSFAERILTAKTSDPSATDTSASLSAGMMYYNTSTGNMKVYSGSSWGNVSTASLAMNDLTDVTTSGVANEKILKYNSTNTRWEVADAGGSGTTTYANTAAMISDSSNVSAGAQGYVTANNSLYTYNGNGWYRIAVINTTPTISSPSVATHTFATDGTAVSIEITAADVDEGTTINYGYTVSTGSLTNGGGATAAITSSSTSGGTYSSLAASTNTTNKFFKVTPTTNSDYAGDFSLTFYATDSISQATVVQNFTITFIVSNSNYSSLLAQASGSNAATNSTFTDSGSAGLTQTVAGTVSQGSFSPYRHIGYSTLFTGSNQLETPSGSTANSNLIFGANENFSIELWIKFHDVAARRDIFYVGHHSLTNAAGDHGLYLDASYGLRYQVYNSGIDLKGSSQSFVVDKWYHVLIGRSGTTAYMFVDGQSHATHTSVGSVVVGHNDEKYNFGKFDTNGQRFQGLLYSFQVRDAMAHTSNFTPPTTPVSVDSNTMMMLFRKPFLCDESSTARAIQTNDSTTSKQISDTPLDYTGYSATTNLGSMWVNNGNNSNDYVLANSGNSSTAFGFGSGSFTVECWFFPLSLPSGNTGTIVDFRNAANGATGVIVGTGSNHTIGYYNGSSWSMSGSNDVYRDHHWNHVALVRDGSANTAKVYLNGKEVVSVSDSNDYSSTLICYVGENLASSGSYAFSGYISDLRVNKSVIYSAAFPTAVPSSPLATGSATFHLKFNAANIKDISQSNNLQLAGNTKVSSTQTKFSSNTIELDGTGDYIQLDDGSSDLNNLAASNFSIEGWFYMTANAGSGSSSHVLVSKWDNSNNNKGFILRVTEDSSAQKIQWLNSVDGSSNTLIVASTATVSLNTWYWFSVVRDGSNLKLRLNGSEETLSSSVGNTVDTTITTLIGATHASTTPEQFFQGFLQDVSIRKGVVTTNAVPTALLDG
tara:strand:- start:932 stop:4870 length:3939 start_codon:yes stop_codon:yes gene_type:complete